MERDLLIADFDGNGAVWQDDIPADLLDQMGDAGDAAGETGTDASDEGKPPEPAGPGGKKPRPSHLKLVK